jgi:hypothetical protein
MTHEPQSLHLALPPLLVDELAVDAPRRKRRQVVRPRDGEAIGRVPGGGRRRRRPGT